MSKYMTMKQLKEEIVGFHENWDDFIVLINDEPLLNEYPNYNIQVAYPDSERFQYDVDDVNDNGENL